MNYKWSIGLMTGTVNDGFIDVAALKTDGHQIMEYGPFELIPYQNSLVAYNQFIDNGSNYPCLSIFYQMH